MRPQVGNVPQLSELRMRHATLDKVPGLTELGARDRRVAEWRRACGDVPANTEAGGPWTPHEMPVNFRWS